MAIRTEDRNKEEARLFFEYLRESEDYAELCNLIRQGKELSELPKKFQPATGTIQLLNPLVLTYARFGDIHAVGFEVWFKDKIDTTAWPGFSQAHIKDGLSAISNDLDICLKIFQDREGREPTGQELKTELLSWVKNKGPFSSYFEVHRNQFTVAEACGLGKEFHSFLTKGIKKESGATKLGLYLKAYQQIKSGTKASDVNLADEGLFLESSEVLRYQRWAKKIINNAEHGVFPGKYR